MILRRTFITLLLLTALASQAAAQQSDPSILTLDRLYGSTEFVSQTVGPVRWLDDGAGYTRLEPSGTVKDGRDIVRYDVETGRREVLVVGLRRGAGLARWLALEPGRESHRVLATRCSRRAGLLFDQQH